MLLASRAVRPRLLSRVSPLFLHALACAAVGCDGDARPPVLDASPDVAPAADITPTPDLPPPDDATDAATDVAGDVTDAPPTQDAPDAAVGACAGIPRGGRCLSPTRREDCVSLSEGAPLVRAVFDCPPDTACVTRTNGASCALTTACREGETTCGGVNALRTCTAGRIVTTPCATDCVESGLTAFCRPAFALRSITGHVLYAGRRPDVSRAAWGPTVNFYGQDFQVVSGYGRPVQYLDVARTRTGNVDPGAFTLRVRATPDATDFIAVLPAAYDPRGYTYVLADPSFAPGPWPFDATADGTTMVPRVPGNPRLWMWLWPLATLPASGDLIIDEDSGSGAAFVYDLIGITARTLAPRVMGPTRTLVVWLGPEVETPCGSVACFSDYVTRSFFQDFDEQMWIPGTAANRSYYSASTVVHELGHQAMASHGVSPREGGPHYLGDVATAGLAWSEGFAHWFSSDVRDDATHFDRHLVRMAGTPSVVTFTKDLAARRWSYGAMTGMPARATPAAGLLQPLDEDDIAATLWTISRGPAGAAPFYAALGAPRMTTAALLYGYTSLGSGDEVPVFPDFLDALGCAGVASTALRAATQPERYFPYPSPADPPRCPRASESPVLVTWRSVQAAPGEVTLVGRVEVRATLAVPLEVRVTAPTGATVTPAETHFTAPPLQAGAVIERAWRVRGAPGPVTLAASARADAWSVRAETTWPPEAPRRMRAPDGPHLTGDGVDYGPAMQMR
jgi:hypothetical protein